MKVDFSVSTLEVSGFAAVFESLRLPFGKDCRSQVPFVMYENEEENKLSYGTSCTFEPKDIKLLSTLIKRGDEHAKAVRGLIVYAMIDAPRYWWCEMDTYHIGSERLASESTMHIQGKGLSTEELVSMKEHLEEGTMQKRGQYFSYQTLRRIWKQRNNHRLPHWHKFCEWIETLPYAKELILVGLTEETGE